MSPVYLEQAHGKHAYYGADEYAGKECEPCHFAHPLYFCIKRNATEVTFLNVSIFQDVFCRSF